MFISQTMPHHLRLALLKVFTYVYVFICRHKILATPISMTTRYLLKKIICAKLDKSKGNTTLIQTSCELECAVDKAY